MKKQKSKKTGDDRPGVRLEKIVASLQQMMDPQSKVTHNEKLTDRVGNLRQYDVVIRGSFGGRDILGIVECKDHKRRKGPTAVEAFAKKTENLGANLRLIVSRKGFTKQALKLAEHEGIGCLSLLPEDPKLAGFSVGDMWYGTLYRWDEFKLTVYFAPNQPAMPIPNVEGVTYRNLSVFHSLRKEFLTTYQDDKQEGFHTITCTFEKARTLRIDGVPCRVMAVALTARRIVDKKKKWVRWTGDAFFDWHKSSITIPPGGRLMASAVETDIYKWDPYDGEIPDLQTAEVTGLACAVVVAFQKWADQFPVIDWSKL